MGTVVAAFDVDNTLTARDCVVPFLGRIAGGRRALALRLATQPLRLAAAGLHRDRDRAKAAATRAVLAGRRADRIAAEGRAFAGLVATSWLRADTAARLRWHLAQGHRVVLVSASYEVYVAPLAETLGVGAGLGTRLVVDADGVLTGALDGPNCRGEEKAVRLRAWLADHGFGDVELWAYGDSAGDDAMLAMAAHPVRVDGPISAAPETA
jgi:phosphatidylglycerophosphatase C